MYIQITTRCNMSCAHCCYDCGPDGEDMSLEVFEKALEYDNDSIAIGGGEPTIHPLFWQFMGLAIGSCEYVWLATNGKETKTALTLAKLAKRNVIRCDLSQDGYHEEIDVEVIDAFEEGNHKRYSPFHDGPRDGRSVRNVTGREINSGRCDFGEDGCPCPEPIVKPNGDVHQCGCIDSPKIGNVLDGELEIENYGECYKDLEACEC